MNIVFFGSSRFVIPIIEKLRKNYTVSLIVTTEDKLQEAIPTYANKENIPYISVKKIDQSVVDKISSENAEFAVLAFFGIIVPNELLTLFPKGILNIHPSLLPKYRGPTPIQSAIVAGEKITGVSIIKLDTDVDHGPILVQKEITLYPDDTATSVYERVFPQGADMLVSVLPDYLSGKLIPKEQDHKKATFTNDLTRESGYIDSNNPPSKEIIDRMIRAYYPWPGVWTLLRLKATEGQAK